jgi:hypothetical protein
MHLLPKSSHTTVSKSLARVEVSYCFSNAPLPSGVGNGCLLVDGDELDTAHASLEAACGGIFTLNIMLRKAAVLTWRLIHQYTTRIHRYNILLHFRGMQGTTKRRMAGQDSPRMKAPTQPEASANTNAVASGTLSLLKMAGGSRTRILWIDLPFENDDEGADYDVPSPSKRLARSFVAIFRTGRQVERCSAILTDSSSLTASVCA